MKRKILISDKKNDQETIEQRHFFAVKYRIYSDEDILYLDETGFNLHSKRSYEYSPKNVPARLIVKGNRGQNVTLIIIISKNRILHNKIIKGPCNSVIFKEFFEEIIRLNRINPNNIIVMDNVAFHKTNEIKNFFELTQ
ncbi:hypothetical protein DMUE_5953 [Dictyocoela muelleri]|nr:hypothetical protein DMUE_5953 [Dictyocoela muelleri]